MSTATKLTYDDYCVIPDDGRRHEIVDGEHYVVPAPNLPHQVISGKIHLALANYLSQHPGGLLVYAPADVILSPINVVQPDLLFVRAEHSTRIERRGVVGAPDLIVEILSDSNRRYDEVVKRKLYEQFGVTEYWIVDPDAHSVEILRLNGAAYERVAELHDGDILTSAMFPGLELPLATIFA